MSSELWASCTNPLAMTNLLPSDPSERKRRLCIVAFCRLLKPSRMRAGAVRRAVEVAERYADGLATEEEREAAWNAVVENKRTPTPVFCALPPHMTTMLIDEAADPEIWEVYTKPKREPPILCRLIRDLLGDPFRPTAFDPAWLTSTVVALARSIYEDRDFQAMPILADALEEAGCADAALLEHCRGPGPHVRGCWVVDLLTGRE